MPTARYYKSLFLPPLEGQYLLWKHDFTQLCPRVDEVVHPGNLIGCTEKAKDKGNLGPNLAVLNLVSLWRASYPAWTQLVGPNEIMALNFPGEWTNDESTRALRQAWLPGGSENPWLTAAENKGRLVTHGGLTHGEWRSLGSPTTAQEAARLLNEKYAHTLYQGPSFSINGRPSYSANPIFADPLREVYPSWIGADEPCPFGQIHAGNGLNTKDGRQGLNAPLSPLNFLESVRYTPFGAVVSIQGTLFTSLTADLPQDTMVRRLPEPWQVYIERIPVVDLRDELFQESTHAH